MARYVESSQVKSYVKGNSAVPNNERNVNNPSLCSSNMYDYDRVSANLTQDHETISNEAGAGALLPTRVPQTLRIGAIQALINDGAGNINQGNSHVKCDRPDALKLTSDNQSNSSLDSRSIVAASKFATPRNPNNLAPPPKTSLSSSTVSVNGISPPPLAAKGPGIRTRYVQVDNLPTLCNGNSVAALKPVTGQTYYSGHVNYEPPPIYSRGILNSTKSLSGSISNLSNHSHNLGNGSLLSNSNYSLHSDVIIKPHSLANLKIHTYENVTSCKGHERSPSTNLAATIIENQYASPRSSVSSQESKHSSPRNSLVQNLQNSSLERKGNGNQVIHERISLDGLHSNSNSPIFKSQCIALNRSSLNLGNQLPPRIEQDLEGRQFVIPRNNAYVQENARQSNQWNACNDPVRHRSIYCDSLHPQQPSQQGQSCCLSCSSHTPISTPIATPSPTSFAPPPPYPGKPPSISSLSSSIDLNDSVLSLGSLRSASGVLASVNANHNYANIDILKGNSYISEQQLHQQLKQQKGHWGCNGTVSKAPPPPPYPSSVVRQAQPNNLLNRPHQSQVNNLGQLNTSYGGNSPSLSIASSRSTQSIHSHFGHTNGFQSPEVGNFKGLHRPPPTPPPYPSTVVRLQLLGPVSQPCCTASPSLPPYPSTAVRGIATSCPTAPQPLIASQPKPRVEPPSNNNSYTSKAILNNSAANMDASKLSNTTQSVNSITAQIGQLNVSTTNNGESSSAGDRLNKWQNKLNPSYGDNSDSSSSVGGGGRAMTGGPVGSSSGGEMSDTCSERSVGGTEKPRSKHSGKSLLPYNVTAKPMVSTLLFVAIM